MCETNKVRTIIRVIGFLVLVVDSFSLPSTVQNDTEKSSISYRLPSAVVPSHYTVELQPILDEGHGTRFTSPGKVWINVTCREATNNITLHALTVNISESSVKVLQQTDGNEIGIASFDEDATKHFFIIKLRESLRAGSNYQIYIEFQAPVSQDLLVGLYVSNYTTSDGTLKYMAVTKLEATETRRVFPCFDEPQMKATFDVSVIRLPPFHSLSNMDLLRTETILPGLPGWVKDVYKSTQKMSTYLFCIVVSDFELEEASPGHYRKPVRIWGPPPLMRNGAGKYSSNLTAKLITAMEDYFRIPYTFPKMDKVAVPHFISGAMENWGLNTYRLYRLLVEDGISTAADRVSIAITLSHELVHQWFGNLVTLEWWDDLWLNEAFASYYSNTILALLGKDYEDMLPLDTLVSDSVQRGMHYDVTSATHPLHYPKVQSPTEIRIMFDTATYSKGSAIVRMMHAILGETLMQQAIIAYLKRFEYSNAHQDGLFQVLDEAIADASRLILPSGITMKNVMDTWTLQTGFPVLSVRKSLGSTSVIVSQEEFNPDKDDPDSIVRGKWHIPVSLLLPSDSEVDTSTKVWLRENDGIQTLSGVSGAWFIVNPQQTGYYRVKYDTNSLQQIIEQLHKDHTVFDAQTRSALVDDNLSLAYAGYIDVQQALNLTMYLKHERNLVPWNSFFTNMAKPNKLFSRSAGFSSFKTYIVGLTKDALDEIKLDPQPSEPIGNATLLRNKLFQWVCKLGDRSCIDYSSRKYSQWMQRPADLTLVFPDLRPFVYCAAIENGGEKEWNFALQQYIKANRDVTKVNLIRALGCSRSAYRLYMLLEMAININSEIDDAHRLTAIQSVAENPAGIDLVLNFIQEHFASIQRRFGVKLMSDAISSVSNSLFRESDIRNLKRFIMENEVALSEVKTSLEAATKTIESNIRWLNRVGSKFISFTSSL